MDLFEMGAQFGSLLFSSLSGTEELAAMRAATEQFAATQSIVCLARYGKNVVFASLRLLYERERLRPRSPSSASQGTEKNVILASLILRYSRSK